MLYAVNIFETVVKTIVVDAETEEKAKEEAERRYFDGEPFPVNEPVFDFTEIDIDITKTLNLQGENQ